MDTARSFSRSVRSRTVRFAEALARVVACGLLWLAGGCGGDGSSTEHDIDAGTTAASSTPSVAAPATPSATAAPNATAAPSATAAPGATEAPNPTTPPEATTPPAPDPSDPPVTVPTTPESHDVAFTPTSTSFAGNITVTLSSPSGAGAIHYTVDGSVPTEDSPIYTEPLDLDQSTLIRAATILEDSSEPERVTAATYLALDGAVADFTSDLPIVVVERHGDAPIDTDSNDLRASSVLTFEPPQAGRATLLGPPTLWTRAGVRVRGQTSRNFPQKSYRIEFWLDSADDDRDLDWLSMPEESDWVLIAPSQMDRSLMRTMLPMDLSRSLGHYASRTRFVEVFIVDREGSTMLSMDDYVGVYTAGEEIKRGSSRVDVERLDDADTDSPDVTGGYIFRIDHGEDHFNVAGYDFQWDYPDAELMLTPEREPQREYLEDELSGFFAALDDPDFTNPDTGRHYSDYVDVDAWIDHNWLNALTKNVDGLRLSAYFHKARGGLIVAGPIWDFDRSAGTPHDNRAESATEWASGDGTEPLSELFWADLFQDRAFQDAYWARWDELKKGAFSVSSIEAMIDDYDQLLAEARERHFERWPELEPQGGPEGEVELLRQWFGERIPWLDSQRP